MFRVSKLNRSKSNMNPLSLCVLESGQKTQNCHPTSGSTYESGLDTTAHYPTRLLMVRVECSYSYGFCNDSI